MILADTSVWVDHLRGGDDELARQLEAGAILMHPFILGEIALGSLRQRKLILSSLRELPTAAVAEVEEVLLFVEARSLAGLGIGYVDAHLLASVSLMPGSGLWTRDKRLAAAAGKLHLSSGLP